MIFIQTLDLISLRSKYVIWKRKDTVLNFFVKAGVWKLFKKSSYLIIVIDWIKHLGKTLGYSYNHCWQFFIFNSVIFRKDTWTKHLTDIGYDRQQVLIEFCIRFWIRTNIKQELNDFNLNAFVEKINHI